MTIKELGTLSQRRRKTEMHRLSGIGDLKLLKQFAPGQIMEAREALYTLPALIESKQTGRVMMTKQNDVGRLLNEGHSGLGTSSIYNEAQKSRFAYLGLMSGNGPQVTDTKGFKTNDPAFLKTLKGTLDTNSSGADYGDVAIKHKGDSVQLGHNEFPTKWRIVTRSQGIVKAGVFTQKTDWKTTGDTTAVLKAGETQTITNAENDSADIDIYITLLEVGFSGEQIKKQEAEAAATKDKQTTADTSIAKAQASLSDMEAQSDTDPASISTVKKLIADAQVAYAKPDYDLATATAKKATAVAIDAVTLAKTKAIAQQIADTQKDGTLTAEQKKAIVDQLNQQKVQVNAEAADEKAQNSIGFTFGMNAPTIGILAIIGIAIAGGIAAVAMRKKK